MSQTQTESGGRYRGGGYRRFKYTANGDPICHNWNMGFCSFGETCRYKHVCENCEGEHPVQKCPKRSNGSGNYTNGSPSSGMNEGCSYGNNYYGRYLSDRNGSSHGSRSGDKYDQQNRSSYGNYGSYGSYGGYGGYGSYGNSNNDGYGGWNHFGMNKQNNNNNNNNNKNNSISGGNSASNNSDSGSSWKSLSDEEGDIHNESWEFRGSTNDTHPKNEEKRQETDEYNNDNRNWNSIKMNNNGKNERDNREDINNSTNHERQLDIPSLLSLPITQFLSHFGLNDKIAPALADQEIVDVETLLECDISDIIELTKLFSNHKEISMKDKIKFRKTMKMVIEENEKQLKSSSKAKSKSMVVPVLSAVEHDIISTFYGQLDEVTIKIKKMQENINDVTKKSESNVRRINDYYDSLVKLIKNRKNDIMNEHNKIVQEKIGEYEKIITNLTDYETMIKKEITFVKDELLINDAKKTSNNKNKNKNKNDDILKQFVKVAGKLRDSLEKIEKYGTENDAQARQVANVEFLTNDEQSAEKMLGAFGNVDDCNFKLAKIKSVVVKNVQMDSAQVGCPFLFVYFLYFLCFLLCLNWYPVGNCVEYRLSGI